MNPKMHNTATAHLNQMPYKSSPTAESHSRKTRPESSKRDTDQYLQNYQSPLADGLKSDSGDKEAGRSLPLSRQLSGGSTSPSDYSSDSNAAESSSRATQSDSGVRRRSGNLSKGGSDRRRLAIVQMETVAETSKSPDESSHRSGSIRLRRGHPSNLAGLALVAPPDAAVKTYTELTPPSTAPLTGERPMGRTSTTGDNLEKGHARSASEATNTKKTSPRDVGIVGTGLVVPATSVPKETRTTTNNKNVAHPPIFQQPHSRSSSPAGVVPTVSDHTHNLLSPLHSRTPMSTRSDELVITPEIGEGKDIGTRVAAPVVVSLETSTSRHARNSSTLKASPAPQIVVQQAPTTSFPPNNSSTYLHYQPGVHATAGPLPPPPRALFSIDSSAPPPPRPPRLNSPNSTRVRGDIEAVKQALQLPPSVSAALASRSPKPKSTSVVSESQTDMESDAVPPGLRYVKSVHRREGAFSPSTSTKTSNTDSTPSEIPFPSDSKPSSSDSVKDQPRVNDSVQPNIPDVINDGPPITIIKPLNLKVEPKSGDKAHELLTAELPGQRNSDELSRESLSESPPHFGHSGETPSPPPKSFRNSLTTGLKRFSALPRTPSVSSRSTRRSSVGTTHYSSRTPSPSMMVHVPSSIIRPKTKSKNPSAMYCSEVSTRKTSLERSAVYAQKINELYTYDCGLADWIVDTKLRANTNRPHFSAPHTFTPQPRHTSRASMISEATFPRRPDASTATDLAIKTYDIVPTSPPPLPYPSLANSRRFPARSSSVASATPPSSIRSLAPLTPASKAGGFFASLGRKTSMSSARGGKPSLGSPSSPGKLLTKNPPLNPAPRIINISAAPSVPGGPRAPPQRALRSQTIMTTTNPFASNSPTSDLHDILIRRPSLSNISQERVIDIQADPEFVRQVDKLADLLPHADRGVLAGYLRRTGQDILAIGQYLEDEKNGTLRA